MPQPESLKHSPSANIKPTSIHGARNACSTAHLNAPLRATEHTASMSVLLQVFQIRESVTVSLESAEYESEFVSRI
jgi:hypothetical protein